MKISARNQLSGFVTSIQTGPIHAEVTLALPGGQKVVAVITAASVTALGLREGSPAIAIIKSSAILLGVE